MPARLQLYPLFHPAQILITHEGSEYLLGRDPQCHLVVEDERVSRRHAALLPRPGGWMLRDLGSKNGTALDGMAITEHSLENRHWLSLGGVPGRFERLSEDEGRALAGSELRRWRDSREAQRRLTPALGAPLLLERLLESVLLLAGADRGFVLLTGDDGQLEVAATAGVTPGELGEAGFAGSVGAVERALASGRPVATCDAQDVTWLEERPSVADAGIRALVAVPLAALDRRLGVLYADSRHPGKAFTQLDVEILEALASHGALTLSLARMSDEVRRLLRSLEAEGGDEEGRRRERRLRDVLPPPAPPAGVAGRSSRRDGPATWSDIVSAHGRGAGTGP